MKNMGRKISCLINAYREKRKEKKRHLKMKKILEMKIFTPSVNHFNFAISERGGVRESDGTIFCCSQIIIFYS